MSKEAIVVAQEDPRSDYPLKNRAIERRRALLSPIHETLVIKD